jgi:alanine-synthesizing transaminase
MFVWAKIPPRFADMGAVGFASELLEKAGVAVAPGVGFGQGGEGHVRFSLIEPDDRVRQAGSLVSKLLKS